MSRNLYSELGVPKSASKKDIKRAYRRKAKEHHPDKNGSLIKWHALQQAYETLSDDGARSRYDETGEVGGKPQLLRDKAIAELARLFLVLAEAADTQHHDLVKMARNQIDGAITEQRSSIQKIKSRTSRLKDAADRFTVKGDEENFAAGILRNQAEAYERQAASMEENGRVLDEALRLLKAFSYRTEKAGHTDFGHMTVDAQSLEEMMTRSLFNSIFGPKE